MIVTFLIEGEPQGKGRHRTTKAGINYTPGKTAMYENWVKSVYINRVGEKLLYGPIKATIEAYYTIPKSKSKRVRERMLRQLEMPTKKPDVDNIAKAILDSLNGIAYRDDSQIVELNMKKLYADMGFVKVTAEGTSKLETRTEGHCLKLMSLTPGMSVSTVR